MKKVMEELQRSVRVRRKKAAEFARQKLGPGGGYVLGSSHGIEASVPPKNLIAMIQAVQKYGRYGCLGQDA